jgi:GNAT superfamily N-acetyltransferase
MGPGGDALVERAGRLFDGPPRPAATARFLASDNLHLLLALDGDEPIGFVSGVLRALADLARERGCRRMWVLTDEENVAAVATYRRAGATRDERTFLLEWEL